jgi:hypothetical protein
MMASQDLKAMKEFRGLATAVIFRPYNKMGYKKLKNIPSQ